MLEFFLKAPAIKQINDYFWAALNNARDLRLLQAQNAATIAREANVTVTDAAIFVIPDTSNMAILYSTLVVMTDEASGNGLYNMSGRRPTAAGQGAYWPSGGAILNVRGNEQIRKFQIIAATGKTLNVWWALYQ
jgi:hypothetical protein